jgi:hypothetical protein
MIVAEYSGLVKLIGCWKRVMRRRVLEGGGCVGDLVKWVRQIA